MNFKFLKHYYSTNVLENTFILLHKSFSEENYILQELRNWQYFQCTQLLQQPFTIRVVRTIVIIEMVKLVYSFLRWNLKTLSHNLERPLHNIGKCLKCLTIIQRIPNCKIGKTVQDSWFNFCSPISFLCKMLINGDRNQKHSLNRKMTII